MRVVDGFDEIAPFAILRPLAQRMGAVFNSPHSGDAYPRDFLASSRLDARRIRRSEDAFVDALFAGVVDEGAPLLKAHFPRAFLDLNREPYELDPKMFAGRLPPYANIRSVRVAGGLGTVPRVVSEADEIYAGPLPVEAALARIETYYRPYHSALRRLLAETHLLFGFAVLVDCHSMPSAVRGDPRQRADIALGDRYGASCSPALVEHAFTVLSGLGYSVALNKPYAGGFITEHYGRPARGLHALQIEINRGLYMDEATLAPADGFAKVAADMQKLAAALTDLPASLLAADATPAAAE